MTYTRKVDVMRAAACDAFGGPEVVHVAEVPAPTPGPRDVVVCVVAAPVNSADARIRGRRFPKGFGTVAPLIFGITKPRTRVLGGSFAGVVEAVGADVTGWAPGDEVVGTTGMAMGSHAERVAVKADRLVRKPSAVSFEDAAGVVFGGQTPWWFLHDLVQVEPGQRVLVVGASGAVGTRAVQLAALAGARVTGVCSATNAALVRSLGAEVIVDHRTTDILTLSEQFDVVLDTVGTLDRRSGRRLLAPGGVLLLAVASLGDMILARGNVKVGTAPERTADLARLLELVRAGDLRVVIEDALPLVRIAEAHARVDTGRKVGNLLGRP